MKDWRAYWAAYPGRFDEIDFLRQVGTTIDGRPYPEEAFDRMVDGLARGLDLRASSRLLDVCCGNGVISVRLAALASEVVGVDFSPPLLSIAQRHHERPNTCYLRGDALRLEATPGLSGRSFDRVLMQGSMQCIPSDGIEQLLASMLRVADREVVIYLGAIPDKRRRSAFYKSRRRRLKGWWYRLRGRDAMGTWWAPEEVVAAAERVGLRAQILEGRSVADGLSSHYRFDARLGRPSP
jgi:cyclopropane fatty-acyl-phospholipid synthase-like methyltransferase